MSCRIHILGIGPYQRPIFDKAQNLWVNSGEKSKKRSLLCYLFLNLVCAKILPSDNFFFFVPNLSSFFIVQCFCQPAQLSKRLGLEINDWTNLQWLQWNSNWQTFEYKLQVIRPQKLITDLRLEIDQSTYNHHPKNGRIWIISWNPEAQDSSQQ